MSSESDTPASQSAATDEVHTPFCDDNCTVKHHPLLQAVIRLGMNNLKEKTEINEIIAEHKAKGWDLNSPIPDPRADFRYPIIHWSAALSKYL